MNDPANVLPVPTCRVMPTGLPFPVDASPVRPGVVFRLEGETTARRGHFRVDPMGALFCVVALRG